MTTTNWIEYNSISQAHGGLSALFKDYISNFQKVEKYYELDYRNLQQHEKYFQRIADRFRYRRDIVDILKEQNKNINNSENVFANIEKIKNNNCVAVVTGQQVGIFCGPLYTLYKTHTMIELTKHLQQLYPNFLFVPVFWLEGEDHDFKEVNNIGILGADGNPMRIEYAENLKDKNSGAVGDLLFDDHLEKFYDDVNRLLPHTEFKAGLIELLKSHYFPGRSFNTSFASLLSYFFKEEGLIFLSPNDQRIKKLLSPIFITELTSYPKVSQLIIETSAELEEKYHAQIKTKALNLFHFHKGGRYFIEPRENDFSLKGIRFTIPKEEMLRIAHEEPHLLSPNVALRPICQDTLLPTVVYVGGPSEIAYFAQLKKTYHYFGLTMPIIFPRVSVTLVEEKVGRIIEKYQLELSEFFSNGDKIKSKVIDFVSEVNIEVIFKEANRRIEDLIKEMHFGVNYIDPTLIGALENTGSKLQQQMNILRSKITEAQQRKHEIALRQVGKIINAITPNGNLQERELNLITFLNKHGLEFSQRLFKEILIDQFKHQVISI